MNRWNATKDLSWEPLRPELVVEVRYEHLQAGRFRHAAGSCAGDDGQDAGAVHLRPARGRRARRARSHLRWR